MWLAAGIEAGLDGRSREPGPSPFIAPAPSPSLFDRRSGDLDGGDVLPGFRVPRRPDFFA